VFDLIRLLKRPADLDMMRPAQTVVPAQQGNSRTDQLRYAKRGRMESCGFGVFGYLPTIFPAAVGKDIA
jgi:hypothetical protein